MWEAQYVIVIASATGWSESHIRHHLPLSRGWSYYHAARLMAGEKCRWPGQKTAVSHFVDRVRSWASSLWKTTRHH